MLLSRVRLCNPMDCSLPPSMEFSRQEYWSGLPFPSPGYLPDPGIEPGSSTLQADILPSELPGKSIIYIYIYNYIYICTYTYIYIHIHYIYIYVCFPHSSVGKESACSAGDASLIPRSGISTGKGLGYPLEYSWASLVAQLVENPTAMQET